MRVGLGLYAFFATFVAEMNHRLSPKSQLATPYGHDLPALHSLKLICAFLVVMIHSAVGDKAPWLEDICRIAVPVFFMITGYFMVGIDGTVNTGRIARTIKKLIWLFIGLQSIYFLRWLIADGHSMESLAFLRSPRVIFHALVFGDIYGIHLWYISAAAEGLIIIWLAAKLKIDRWLYLLVPLGLLTGLFVGRYYPFGMRGYVHGCYIRNFFTFAIPCLVIGIALRRRQMPGWSNLAAWSIAALALFLMVMESIYVAPRQQPGDYVILTVPAAALVFIACCKIESSPAILSRLGQKYSSGIYYYHVLVIYILGDIFSNVVEWPWLSPLVFLISLGIAAGIDILKKRIPLLGWKRARGGYR